MRRYLVHGAALAIGIGALLAARSVVAEDGPIIPGLDSLPPISSPPPRSLPPTSRPPTSRINEPPLTERPAVESANPARPIERGDERNRDGLGRDVRGTRPDPFGDAPRGDRAVTVERQNIGGEGPSMSSDPQRVPQFRADVQRYRQSPQQQPAQANPAIQRYRQQMQAPPARGANPSTGRGDWNDPGPRAPTLRRTPADPRQPSTMRRGDAGPSDPRAVAGNRPDAQRNAVQQRASQPPPLSVQRSSPKAQPKVQPRAAQAPPRGLPPRARQPSGGQQRR